MTRGWTLKLVWPRRCLVRCPVCRRRVCRNLCLIRATFTPLIYCRDCEDRVVWSRKECRAPGADSWRTVPTR
jgi:hypothetical protein